MRASSAYAAPPVDGSVDRRRVGERAGKLDSDAAVGVFRQSGGIRELAEPAAVGAHGEDLAAEGVGAERVATRIEDDCLRHCILEDGPIVPVADSAPRR